jgi:hypothetical protein
MDRLILGLESFGTIRINREWWIPSYGLPMEKKGDKKGDD